MQDPVPLRLDVPESRGLWLCFWVLLGSALVWVATHTRPSAPGQGFGLAILLAVPLWFLTGRVATWMRAVAHGEAQPADAAHVQRWRWGLLVLSVLSTLGAVLTIPTAPASGLGTVVLGVGHTPFLWLSGPVVRALHATGAATPVPQAPMLAPLLPRWTLALRAAQGGQLAYGLLFPPPTDFWGLVGSLIGAGAWIAFLELLLRFARARAALNAAQA